MEVVGDVSLESIDYAGVGQQRCSGGDVIFVVNVLSVMLVLV
jgi:hypothetical protein